MVDIWHSTGVALLHHRAFDYPLGLLSLGIVSQLRLEARLEVEFGAERVPRTATRRFGLTLGGIKLLILVAALGTLSMTGALPSDLIGVLAVAVQWLVALTMTALAFAHVRELRHVGSQMGHGPSIERWTETCGGFGGKLSTAKVLLVLGLGLTLKFGPIGVLVLIAWLIHVQHWALDLHRVGSS